MPLICFAPLLRKLVLHIIDHRLTTMTPKVLLELLSTLRIVGQLETMQHVCSGASYLLNEVRGFKNLFYGLT